MTACMQMQSHSRPLSLKSPSLCQRSRHQSMQAKQLRYMCDVSRAQNESRATASQLRP